MLLDDDRMLRVVGTIRCVALLAALGGCNTTTTTPSPSTGLRPDPIERPTILYHPRELRDLTPGEKTALAKAMSRGLRDPESARFQWLQFPRYPENDTITWCGMVNSKNAAGQYTGAKPYVGTVTLRQGKIVGGSITDTATDDAGSEAIREECQKYGWDPRLAT
jgi:hypothetical protein